MDFGLEQLLSSWHPIFKAVVAPGVYGAANFAVATLPKVEEARAVIRRLLELVGAK